MSRDQLVQRMLCSEARVDSKKLRFEWKRPERFKYIIDVVNRLYNAKLYIDDTPSISVLEMRAKARRLKSEVDLGLIVVDYLQLMEVGPGFRRAENRQQEITVISRALKALAKELNVPVLALSQLSRAAEQHPGPPRLSDLRESGSIEQDSDLVLFLYQEQDGGKPERGGFETPLDQTTLVMDLIVAKHRNGPTGSMKLVFNRPFTRFESYSGRTEF
jgi:replicative DNA helicase